MVGAKQLIVSEIGFLIQQIIRHLKLAADQSAT